jgi:hypothetical protein
MEFIDWDVVLGVAVAGAVLVWVVWLLVPLVSFWLRRSSGRRSDKPLFDSLLPTPQLKPSGLRGEGVPPTTANGGTHSRGSVTREDSFEGYSEPMRTPKIH